MSASKLLKLRTGSSKDDSPSVRQEKKSFINSKSKRKVAVSEPSAPSDLARLLANRSRALLLFERPDFDADAFLTDYLANASDTAIDNARQDLGALLAACGEQVEGVVHANHQAWLEACRGVAGLEDQVALLRNYINGLSALVASLRGTNSLAKQVAAASPLGGEGPQELLSPTASGGERPSRVAAIESQLEVLLQELDVAVAECDLPTARTMLRVGTQCLAVLDRDASLLSIEVEDFPGWRHQVESALALRQRALVTALERQLGDASATPAEIRHVTRALADLVGDRHAASAMLMCYSAKIGRQQQQLIKHFASGADPDVLDFAGGFVQHTMLELGRAADDLAAIFTDPANTTNQQQQQQQQATGSATSSPQQQRQQQQQQQAAAAAAGGGGPAPSEQRHLSALFSVWVQREGRSCAAQLRRHALATAGAAASTGLSTIMQVVGLALVYCAALESSHQVSLTASVTLDLWPTVEAALRRHLKRFSDELRMSAGEEVDSLVASAQAGGLRAKGAPQGPLQVSHLLTGTTLCNELAQLCGLLVPLAGAKVSAALSRGIQTMFGGYTTAIGISLKAHLQESPAAAAALQPLVPALMEALAGLIEEGLPEALAPYTKVGGPLVDSKQLEKSLSALYRECQAGSRAARQQQQPAQ